MLMLDLAVPRDVEAEAGELDDVFLYSVDDLGKLVQEGRDMRQGAVSKAEAIIDAGVDDLMHGLGTRAAVPTIRALRNQAELRVAMKSSARYVGSNRVNPPSACSNT